MIQFVYRISIVGRHAQVCDCYVDQRSIGQGYEEFYRRCQEEGTVFIRGKVADITDQVESESDGAASELWIRPDAKRESRRGGQRVSRGSETKSF